MNTAIKFKNSQHAFDNAIDKGVMTSPEDYMYMYTKTFNNGDVCDVFKHIMTRQLETVKIN